jgi:hypothetical protein
MKNWKTKLFGDNAFNFYGWNLAAVLVLVGSARYVLVGAHAESAQAMQRDMLLGIYILVLGCFGLLLQNYLARLAVKLEKTTDSKLAAPTHE